MSRPLFAYLADYREKFDFGRRRAAQASDVEWRLIWGPKLHFCSLGSQTG